MASHLVEDAAIVSAREEGSTSESPSSLREWRRPELTAMAARVCDRVIFGGALLLLLLAPWFYGADHAEALVGLGFGVGGLWLLWVLKIAVAGEGRWAWSWAHVGGLLLLGLALLQLAPLPVSVEHIPSPEGAILFWNRLTRDPAATAVATAKLVLLLAYFCLLMLSAGSTARLRTLEIALLGNGAVLAFLGLLNALSATGPVIWSFSPGSPSFGPYANRAHFSALMEMIMPLGLARVFSEGWGRRGASVLLVPALVVMGAAVGVAASRAGMTLVALQWVVVPWLVWRGRDRAHLRSTFLRACVLMSLVIGGGMWIGGEFLHQRVLERFREDALTVRGEIWRATLRMIGDHPVFGVGLGAFATVYPRYDASPGLRYTAEAHNDYLQLLAEAGIVGGLIGAAFLSVLVGTIRRSLSRAAEPAAVGASVGILAILIHSIVDFGLRVPANGLVFLSLLVVLLRLDRGR
ncbi:hypothetical protein HRbin10_01130 [bacterium HR10]|nr:hypothetical protein HRbin10_01130 [bacterium HR10]